MVGKLLPVNGSGRQPPSEFIRRIKAGKERRQEEERRRSELRREYLEEMRELMNSEADQGARKYLPSILFMLIFTSFPLSEREIDWILVSLFCLVNILCMFLLPNPSSWMHILFTFLSNVLLIRSSTVMYKLPEFISSIQPYKLGLYVLGNIVITIILYHTYVSQRWCWWRSSAASLKSYSDFAHNKNVKKNNSINKHANFYDNNTELHKSNNDNKSAAEIGDKTVKVSDAILEEYARAREWADRLDLLCCALLLGNLLVLILLDFIPREVIWMSLHNLLRLFK